MLALHPGPVLYVLISIHTMSAVHCALCSLYFDILCGCLGAWQTVSQHNDKGIQDVDSLSSVIKYFYQVKCLKIMIVC